MPTIPSPRVCGIPESAGIDKWRPMQVEALTFMRESTQRVKALCAPTGSGKSALAVADALLSKKPTCVVTHSRALQDQYLRLYADAGMVDLRGRGNYECSMRPDVPGYSCEHGHAAGCPEKGRGGCPASQAEMRAGASWLVVTNYKKWIQSRKYGVGLQHIEKVIFDEGHESFPELADAMQVILSQRDIEDIRMDFPPHAHAQFFSVWPEWATLAKQKAHDKMKKAEAKMHERDATGHHVRTFTHLRNLVRKLSILSLANPLNWVVEELPKGYQFDPIHPGRYVESTLLLKVPDVTFISGTLTKKTLFMIGIGQKVFEMRDYPSEFDPKRCPIYYIPTMRVDSKAANLDALWNRLDQFAARRRDRNGLVHTISFTRRDDVISSSRVLQEALAAGKLYYNAKGEAATQTIEDFVGNYPGAVLVSPSVGQGFDFKGRAAEWQFICKIPFPPPSKVLTARCDPTMGGDAEHAMYLAWQKLVQMAGRVMRDHRDRGETVLADDHLQWFMRYRHLAPRSFDQFFQKVSVLPPPPERLPASW